VSAGREPTPAGTGVDGPAVPQEANGRQGNAGGSLVLERPEGIGELETEVQKRLDAQLEPPAGNALERNFAADLRAQRRYSAALVEQRSPIVRYWRGRDRILGRCPRSGCAR